MRSSWRGCLMLLLVALCVAILPSAGAEELTLTDWEEDTLPLQTAPAVTQSPPPEATAIPADAAYLTFDQTEITLVKGKGLTLKPVGVNLTLGSKTKYTWSTSKQAIAGVSDKGRVTANGGGTCKVWCTVTQNGISYTAECQVTVLVSVSSLKARDESPVMIAGETREMDFIVKPDDVTDARYTLSSDSPDIVRVNADGTITALAAGSAKITAAALDDSGKKGTVTVRVATLRPESLENTVSLRTGGEVWVDYLGSATNLKSNITVTTKARCFSVSPVFEEGGLRLVITPSAVGEDTVTLKDAKSANTPVTLTIRVDNRLGAPTVPAVESLSMAEDTLRVTMVNHGGEAINGYSLRYAFYNAAGEQLFAGSSGRVDYAGETVTMSYMGLVAAGASDTVRDFLPELAGVASFRAAVDSYQTVDGTRWAVPENSLRWVDSALGEVDARGIAPESVSLTASEAASATEEGLGLMTVALPAGFSEQYGFDHMGRWVTLLPENGLAAKAGIRAGDLIFAVDDVPWTDDPFILQRAALALAAGQKTELQLERGGKTVKVTLKP